MPSKNTATKTQKQSITSKKWFKFGLPALLVVILAAAGAYYVNRSKAATGYIDTKPNYISSISGHGCVTSGKYPPTLSQGSRGECVKALQLGLNNRKAFIAWTSGGKIPYRPITVDAVYGVATTAAVKEFQSSKGITADGVAGKTTWDQFLTDCTVKASCRVPVSGQK